MQRTLPARLMTLTNCDPDRQTSTGRCQGDLLSKRIDGHVPVLTELEPPPCHLWSVNCMDGTPVREVTMCTDHDCRGEIFECSCGRRWSWSKNCDVGQECVHIALVVMALLD
jgi:hypothetical protein